MVTSSYWGVQRECDRPVFGLKPGRDQLKTETDTEVITHLIGNILSGGLMKRADGRPFARNSFASPAIRHVTKNAVANNPLVHLSGHGGAHLNPDASWDLAAEDTEPARRVLSWKT
jgi:hypothetical protein